MTSLQDQLKNLGFQAAPEAEQTAHDSQEDIIDTSIPVHIQRQTKGRKGKGVTVIFDLPQSEPLLSDYASALRKRCGVGGSIKAGTIELQGDQRQAAKQWLEQKGFKVKLSGG